MQSGENKKYKDFLVMGRFLKLSQPFAFSLFLFSFIIPLCILLFTPSTTLATDYTLSLTTSGSVDINATSGNTAIDSSEVNVITTCRAGYSLTLNTSVADNHLYLGGDSSGSGASSTINPSNGTTSLNQAPNTWGYLVSTTLPTDSSVFLPVSSSTGTPNTLKTPESTSSESDIEDTFNVYYGVSTDTTLAHGAFLLEPDTLNNNDPGSLTYYLTASPSCVDVPATLDITFNKNMDGEGDETDPEDTVTNFPASSENTLDTTNNTLTLSSKTPERSGYTFMEWNTEPDGTGDYYYPGAVIAIGEGDNPNHTNTSGPNGSNTTALTGNVTFYAIWVADCTSATVCYNGNHADAGTMTNQTANSGTTTNLIASNFSRAGFGFAGWNTAPDGSGTQYGPNQNFTFTSDGANLFATWIKPIGTFQTWAGASNMNVGDVIALRDNRDDEVYTVAKLADNNVWIVENLRLVPNTSNITEHNTHNPTQAFLNSYKSSSSTSTDQCSADGSGCVDQIVFNAHNLDRTLTPNHKGVTNDTYWYSYGVMYNWHTATAGHGTFAMTSGNAAGDLCPAGWHLPSGGSNGEWSALASSMVGSSSNAKSNKLRSYPNNFLYSGDYNPSKGYPDGVGIQGRLWSTTPVSNNTKNAYRMGYNSDGITAATTNSWNKWDNFAIRCIYQGGNLPYEDVHVVFADNNVAGVTFTNSNYPTETATPSNPTVNIAENIPYTITATLTTGYEVTSWTTLSGASISNTSSNPAANPNIITITGESTITVASAEIPSYQVAATLGENVDSISFASSDYSTITLTPQSESCTDNNDGTYTCTINLRRSVEYTTTATFAEGYVINTWTAGNNSTVSSSTSNPTTYTITGVSTLSVAAAEGTEHTYNLVYSAGAGTSAPATETAETIDATHDFTVTNSAPIYYGYTLSGWTETENGTTVDYVAGDTITVASTSTTTTKTLYPIYAAVANCPANNICYYDNGADVTNGGRGTMSNRSASSNTSVNLIPSNYSRTGSGFAGWTTAENATPYGPNATITTGDLSSTGLALYAKWVDSTGDLQSWRGCNNMSTNEVIGLTDSRDNNVYAVAKLADDNCWTIENLRLNPRTATINSENTHNPASGFATAAAGSNSSNSLCTTDDDATCINQLQYNTNSLNRSLTQSHNTDGDDVAWYSYGVYYNWYTATAGNGTISTGGGTNVTGDICPKNWHLPTSTSSGEWAALNNDVNGGVSDADAGLRAYPVNLVWSGDYKGPTRNSSYKNGRYWSSTGYDANNAYRMGHQESGSKGATPNGYYLKHDAFAIRCVRDEIVAKHYDVTVTFPQNVTSITFENSKYGTETATPSSPTISLTENASYTVTATIATGYGLDAWTAGQNATIGNQRQNPATITITGNSTLTLSVQEIPSY